MCNIVTGVCQHSKIIRCLSVLIAWMNPSAASVSSTQRCFFFFFFLTRINCLCSNLGWEHSAHRFTSLGRFESLSAFVSGLNVPSARRRLNVNARRMRAVSLGMSSCDLSNKQLCHVEMRFKKNTCQLLISLT